MKAFITARIDKTQVDRLISNGFEVEQGGFGLTGVKLTEAELIEKFKNISEIGVHEFGDEDVVRNPLITEILKRYEDRN